MHYLIFYDITPTKLRTKLAAYLESEGRRIQKSVFLVSTSSAKWKTICKTIAKIVPDGDVVYIPVTEHDLGNAKRLGCPDLAPGLFI